MTENEKTELFDKWYDENYDEWAEGEEGIALKEELEQAFKGGITELENKIADIKANCDLAIEGRDIKIKELVRKNDRLEKDFRICEKNADTYYDQLTKAKELLNEFMRISKASDEDFEHDYSELIGETEQFIKDLEK